MKNKNNKKHYAYGSMVRKPMQMGGDMMMSANPMAPRQQGMQQGMMSSYEKKRQSAIENNMG